MLKRTSGLALLFVFAAILPAASADRGDAFVFSWGPPRLERVNQSYTVLSTMPLGLGNAFGVAVESNQIVVRYYNGLVVFGPDGELRRTLVYEGGNGSMARLRAGWVASTSLSRIDAIAIDGSKRLLIAQVNFPLRLRSLPRAELAIGTGNALRIYAGWPLKMVHEAHFRDDITALESVPPSTIAVATARYPYEANTPDGDPQLFLYDRRRLKVIAHRSFGPRGFINTVRFYDGHIVVSLQTCAVDKASSLRFLRRDLSDSSQEAITMRGPSTLAVLGTHLAIAERSCAFYDVGTLWDYDPRTMRMSIIDDRVHDVFQGDGS
jgi:hypothetical protein